MEAACFRGQYSRQNEGAREFRWLFRGLNCTSYLFAPWQRADVAPRDQMAAKLSLAERASAAIVLEFMLARGAVAAAEALDEAMSTASTDSEEDTKAFEALQTALCAEDATVLGTMCERVLARTTATSTTGAKTAPVTEGTQTRPQSGATQ
jgi:hypothetical protein